MERLTLLVLVQTAAIFYLIYRVHRLEQTLRTGGRGNRTPGRGDGGKVVPLLREGIPPGPFQPKPDSPGTEEKS